MGLIERKADNLGLAVTLMQTAANLDPADAEIANSLAATAADSGNASLAVTEFKRALKLQPDSLQAVAALGRLLTDLERYTEALDLYEKQTQPIAANVAIRHGLGTALLGVGRSDDAIEIFDALIAEGNDRSEIKFMRGRCRLETGQVDAAIEDFKVTHADRPDATTLETLANVYWMQQDNASFNQLLKDAVKLPTLAVPCAGILRRTGAPETALQVLNSNGVENYQQGDAWWIAASAHIDLAQAEKAEIVARRRLAAAPTDKPIKQSLITSLLMQGKAEEVLTMLEPLRRAEPNDQLWIAYEASALRILASPRYEKLVDLDRFVRSYSLPTPDGYDSIDDFNAAFIDSLDRWQQFKAHPLGQSLRDGTQTSRDLTAIDDPVIKTYFRALDAPIRDYLASVGDADDHPLTARNTGNYRFAGSWSVKLHGGGRHVNHVHPEGWISSSYYLSVPAETATDADKAGWIKFSEPPFDTDPPSSAEKWIEPKAGTLVLFPSFLWHGTQPIRDGSIRITAPFDAVPA